MGETTVSPIPLGGGENTSADPATAATTLVKNMTLGPAGENTQRAGLVDTGTVIGTSPVIGLYSWRDWVIAVTADRKVWAMPVGAPYTVIPLSDATAATQLAGTGRPVFSEDGLPRVVIAGGNAPLQWTGGGLCSVLVTVGYTPAATHVAYLGERMLFNDVSNPTQWYWSDLGDGLHNQVDPASFDTADASPDDITGIYSTIRQAFVFGERSLQVYAVGQDPLNPFDNFSTLAVGCSAPYSPLDVDGRFMWLDDKRRIVVSDGSQFQDLSSADISTTLRGFTTVSDCWSYREDINNTTSYVFQFPTEGRELVYDVSRKFWHERGFYPSGLLPYQAHAFWPAYNVHLWGSSTTGGIYRSDATVQTDLGQPLVMERVTGWLDHGSRARKRSNRVRIVCRRGDASASGSTGTLEVRVADDGGPWGDWELVDLGLAGDGDQNADAFPGGVFRRRRYHFRYSGTQSTALLLAEEHFQECAT